LWDGLKHGLTAGLIAFVVYSFNVDGIVGTEYGEFPVFVMIMLFYGMASASCCYFCSHVFRRTNWAMGGAFVIFGALSLLM